MRRDFRKEVLKQLMMSRTVGATSAAGAPLGDYLRRGP